MFNLDLPYSVLAHNFSATFHWCIFVIVIISFFYYLHKEDPITIIGKFNVNQLVFSFLLVCPIVLLFAYYPIEWGTYADREGYLYIFNHLEDSIIDDYGWFIIYSIIKFFSSEQVFFFGVLATLYVGLRYIACTQFSKENNFLLFLLILSSFLFFAYGHNTIRSGVASSFLILAFSLFFKKRIGFMISFILMFMSAGVHKSMIIPIVAFFISLFYRNTKVLIGLWVVSFFASLLLGNYVSEFFGDLVTENAGEQAGDYITNTENSRYDTGFRLDFIIYSLAPIVIGWYYILKKEFKDKLYLTLYGTYIIANSFFVLVIRASFIDRFGYLSWMLMPILLIYPLLKQKMFERQNIVIAFTLIINELFTFIMYLR